MRKSHRRPRNEEDFVLLCLKLLRVFWKCPDLEPYATRGQAQHGVDIVDLSGRDPLRAAQCKLHEEGKLTDHSEVYEEIQKAKTFHPPLDQYLIITTGKVGKDVHDLLIEVNREHTAGGLFSVQVFGWNRIEELLDDYPEIRDWYEGGLESAVTRKIELKLDNLSEMISQTSDSTRSEDYQDRFHSEIDVAKNHIENREYQIAKLLLQQIKVRSWDQLNSRQKFRVLTNLAVIELSNENPKGAAELYFQAKTQQPTDELARTNEAIGYLILGQREKSFELLSVLIVDFPRSVHVLAAFVQSAPESMSLSSLEERLPSDLLDQEKAAIAMTLRATNSDDWQNAERYARAATNGESPSFESWILLGHIIIQSEYNTGYQRFGTEDSIYKPDRLHEAEYASNQALDRAEVNSSISERAEALLVRGQARFFLNRKDEAFVDLEEALGYAPQNPRVIEAYVDLLLFEGKSELAIVCLRRVSPEKLSVHGRLYLGMLLLEKGDNEDRNIAERTLLSIVRSEETLPVDFREHVIEVGLQAFASLNDFDTGRKLLSEAPEESISEVGYETLKAKLLVLQGKQDEALHHTDNALSVMKDSTTVYEIRRLARVLFGLGRYNDALPLWQRICNPIVLSDDTKHLLDCASRLDRHDIMIETLRNLRDAGASDPTLLDTELDLLQIYDPDAAVMILNDEISQRPNDTELKLKRSVLGLALDRLDLVDGSQSAVPEPNNVNPKSALDAVRVLRESGHEQYAVQYAYQVLRHNMADSNAHSAYIFTLSPFGNTPELEDPDHVEAGVVVCYVEQEKTTSYSIVVEDQPDDASQFTERELPPDHVICKAMMGKKVGDTFVLASGIQDRIGRIKSIKNKYIYRFQDCTDQWQVRFPDTPFLQAVSIPVKSDDSGKSEPDFSVIMKSLDDRYEHVEKIKELYASNSMPLHMFGKHFGSNAFDALINLAQLVDVTVKCCVGSVEEREHTARTLRSSNTVVLDLTAIASLFILDRLDILACGVIDFIVSQSTVNELRRMITNKSLLHSNESGVMFKSETGYIYTETTQEQHKSLIKSLRNTVEVLETNCKIESCNALAAMEPKQRETIVEGFGHYGADAILLSTLPGTVLWTDDQAQAIVAKGEYGVSRVWTQVMIERCVDSGFVETGVYLDASAKLGGYGYYFTGINPEIISQAGVISDWKLDSWPLARVLSIFADESIELEQLLHLAAGFLKLLFQETILFTIRQSITVEILENIAKKEGGLQGISSLKQALPEYFGINIVGLMEVNRIFETWWNMNE